MLKKWENVRDKSAEEVEKMAIASIRDSYSDVEKDIDIVLTDMYTKLEEISGLDREDRLFVKYLYFLASDIEYIKMVNSDRWYYTIAEIENIDVKKLEEEYYYYLQTEEEFREHFADVDKYIEDIRDWAIENNIETILQNLGREINEYKGRNC